MRLLIQLIFLSLCVAVLAPSSSAEPLDMDQLLPKDEQTPAADSDQDPESAPPEVEGAAVTPSPPTPEAQTPSAAPEPAVPATTPHRGDVLTLPAPSPSVSVTLPGRGMKKPEVEAKFGTPIEKVDPVGKPPISRWVYKDFTVFFENDVVLHAVVNEP
ncbi:MAG: hypothetical protein HY080_06645 [Gammaproteobacteria bacterium]|nr:hypothetical protein [Gammaproteobacteria bacterium]